MAEKKYLDFAGLGQYDAKIKALIDQKDAATLKGAKDYADGLAGNYDAAGSAASAQAAAVAEAKGYTDTEVAKANAAAATADGKAVAAQGAAEAAQAAADKAQGEVDALETLVGTLPEGSTVTNVVAYVDKKTEGIASEGAMTELAGRVGVVEGKVATIEGDYLVGADKTELQDNIDEVNALVDVLIGDDTEKSVRTIANEELAAKLIAEDAQESLDTLEEIAAWIQEHPEDAAAMNKAIEDLTAYVGEIPGGKATTVTGMVSEAVTAEHDRATGVEDELSGRIDALEEAVGTEGSVDKMIDDAVAAEAALRVAGDEAAEASAAAALKAAQDAQGEVDALEGVVSALDGVVATKAAQADHEALAGRVTTAEGKITTLEGASHTHDNKGVLDGITAQLVADWNDAVAKEHEHANKDVLDGITSTLVSNWNAAEQNAKNYADGLVAEFVAITTGEIDSLFTTGA